MIVNEGININSLYRGQCLYEDKPIQSMPYKRISITKEKELIFNPNQDKYVFFSPSYIHHMYYLIKKMIDTMNSFLQKMNKDYLLINGRDFNNYDKIKKVCESLGMLKKEIRLESFSILYLAQVKNFINDCSIDSQFKFAGQHIPERTDKRVCGGGLGLSEDWLELLKYTTLFIKTKTFKLEDFLAFVLEKKNKRLTRTEICEMFELKNLTLHKVKHITEKNAINKIYNSIGNIFQKKEYNLQNKNLTDSYFANQRRIIKRDRNNAILELE